VRIVQCWTQHYATLHCTSCAIPSLRPPQKSQFFAPDPAPPGAPDAGLLEGLRCVQGLGRGQGLLHRQDQQARYVQVRPLRTLHRSARAAQGCTPHTAHCTLHSAHCTLHTAHCTLHTAHCTLHTAHCTLHCGQYRCPWWRAGRPPGRSATSCSRRGGTASPSTAGSRTARRGAGAAPAHIAHIVRGLHPHSPSHPPASGHSLLLPPSLPLDPSAEDLDVHVELEQDLEVDVDAEQEV
jgi:hypothetical protein